MSDLASNKNRKKKFFTFKRLKNAALVFFGLSVIFMAISFTLVRVAIKSIPDYSMAIQQAVSEQMDLTLKVGLMDAEIYWLVPRLNLFNVDIFDAEGKRHLIHLDEIDLSLDWSESLRTMTPVVGEISLTGLNLQIGINKKSQLVIQDYVVNENISLTLKSTAEGGADQFEISDTLRENFNNLNFKVINSRLKFTDERHEKHEKIFTDINIHLINSGESHVFEVRTNLPAKYGRYAHFIVDVEGDLFDYKNLDGELYIALENISVAPWLDDYWSGNNITANANVDGGVWLEWSGQNILDVTSQVNITNLALHYLDDNVNTWSVDRIDAKYHWSQKDGDWRLDVRDLMVEREGIDWPEPAAATIEMLNSQRLLKLQADFLRIDGFVYLAGMLNSIKEVDVPWLDLLTKHKPSGVLKNLDVELPIDELHDIKINTKFNQLGFSLPDAEPSEVINLQGAIAYLDKTTRLTLDSTNTEIKFNQLFRYPIMLNKLQGTILLSHEKNVWEASSNSIHLVTPYIETHSRLAFNMPDNGRPFVDLTTKFKNGKAAGVSQYLPAGVMEKDATGWIDRSLKAGKVIDGGYQFYGYLGDAPFRGSEGVSLADFNVSGVQLHYLENWPDVKNISANLRFVNDTMLVRAKHGRLYDSDIGETTAYIDNFISPTIDVKGKVKMQLKDIKKFVENSSLRDDVTDYIDNLTFGGQGDLSLELFVPLYGDFHTEVGGRLMIQNGSLDFREEKYELKNIKGEIRFAGDTVESAGLVTELAGNHPGHLIQVDVSTNNQKNMRAYHIAMNGNIQASSLLVSMPEIKGHVKGNSEWHMNIDILNNKLLGETIVKAKIKSDLQGVTSKLPGPLSKTSEKAMPMELDVEILPGLSSNYKLQMQNGDKLELQRLKDKSFVDADAKSIKGSVDINTRKNVDLPIQVNLEFIDLAEFFKFSEEDAEKESNLPPAISPRELPSFDIYVDKLKLKEIIYRDSSLNIQKSKLGAVIKGFKFISEDHVITGKGSWFTGRNNQSVTQLDINIQLDDLGKVFKEMEISDGLFATSGNVNLRWSWQDTPYNFEWKKLQGDGDLHLKDGVLKELDAGAGRIFGLFNFKTLFSLDFGSQVKEGFNFDKVEGSFTFSDENIYSDDFEIESKVATIYMKGKLSIANNSLDQIVTVRPHLGGTVTLGTAVIAGPAIGGAVYLFQKIFNTDRLSEYQYSMTGSFDKPDVKLISAPVVDDEDDDSDY